MRLTACRSCGGTELHDVLSLGEMPLANALLTADQLGEVEPRYPLEVVMCENCALLQLTETVPPAELFSEYAYFSSSSDPMVAHARDIALRLAKRYELGPEDLAVEVGSNDGYLLQHYAGRGIPTLGIDPAANVIEAARAKGVDTLCRFFSPEVAEELRADGKRARVLHANNVIAHVPDINGFVDGIARLLSDDGVAVIETPYARDLVDKLEFDTIYHEHVFYYSLGSLRALFERHGLAIVDVEHIAIHGGSLRVFASPKGTSPAPSESVVRLESEERALGMEASAFYEDFAARVDDLLDELRSFLFDRKAAGKRLSGYGAAAKGTVLLNALGIGPEVIEYVVDATPYKQGRFIPGVRIPVLPPATLIEDRPDEVLIFAWNFASEIVAKERLYRDAGGVFLVPIPNPQILDPAAPEPRSVAT